MKIVIKPTKGIHFFDLRELWYYRELIFFLTWRDIKVRYKQTAIGVIWVILQPLLMMAVFTLFFGKLAKIPSYDIPYPVFVFCGLLPWQLFTRTLTESTNSLVVNQRLITRIYFPRIIVPISTTLTAMVDFFIAFIFYVFLMAIFNIGFSPHIIWFPLFFILLLITALGVGFWLSALNVEFRDVMYTIPFITQFWLFITPVVYPSNMIPEHWRIIYGLNPMAGVVSGMRWSLIGVGKGPSIMLFVSIAISIVVFISGIAWFRWREKLFVDVIGSGGR